GETPSGYSTKAALRSFSAPMPKSCCRPSRKGLADTPHAPPALRPVPHRPLPPLRLGSDL
ncbi:MAG: hypothetical protein FWF88_09415, partial [Peptococcaceae bacterium]|nr:hypothetical protein [Peptococcaceae bacterium]